MCCKEKNTVSKIEGNALEKLNKLLKTDFAEEKKKDKNGDNYMQAITATLVRHLNEQGRCLENDDLENYDLESDDLFIFAFIFNH